MGSGKNILYAPTWEGVYADSSYSSLVAIGDQLKEFCIRTGNNFIFKPHPLTGSIDERFRSCKQQLQDESILGDYGLKEEASIYDYFAIADVLVTDISSVLSDFLYLERPIIVYRPDFVDDLHSKFRVTRCAYIIDSSFGNIESIFTALSSENEPLAMQRKKIRAYIMGPQSESAIDRFLEAINRVCLPESLPEQEAERITRLIPNEIDINCMDNALEVISKQYDKAELKPRYVDINAINANIENMISLFGELSTKLSADEISNDRCHTK